MAPVRAFRVALLAAAVACVNSASADSALAASRHSVRGSAAVDTAVVAASRGGAADLRSTAADLRATALWASLASSAAPPPEPLSCDACILVVSIAQQVAENKTTFNETLALIEQGCSVIGDATFEALCDALAEAMLSLLPFLDEQLKTLAWDIPEGFCSTFFPVCTVPCCAGGPYDPEQLHLSLTGVPGELQVEWVTYNDSASIVQWGPAQAGAPLPFYATGPPSTTYTNGGWVGRLRRATMTGLAPGAAYSYRVGDGTTWSAVVNITTIPANAGSDARPLRFAQLGDGAYDVNSDGTVAALTALVDAGAIDLVVFIGDLSYADG